MTDLRTTFFHVKRRSQVLYLRKQRSQRPISSKLMSLPFIINTTLSGATIVALQGKLRESINPSPHWISDVKTDDGACFIFVRCNNHGCTFRTANIFVPKSRTALLPNKSSKWTNSFAQGYIIFCRYFNLQTTALQWRKMSFIWLHTPWGCEWKK